MKISVNLSKTLKNLVIPIVSLISCIALFLIFITPYDEYVADFSRMKSNLETTNNNLSSNLKILEQTRQNKDKINKLKNSLVSLVPDTANPSDLVGLIDKNSNEYRFRTVDENRSMGNPENDKNKLMEVRFNGKSPGMNSSINFLKSLLINKSKLVKIIKLELTNVPEELFTRVSFNAFSIYASPPVKESIETPLEDLFADPEFMKILGTY